jgi:CopG family nickel-responsive transcriptional regulator
VEAVLLLDCESTLSLKRFGVSIPEDLLERFDNLVEKKGYVGRSEAIRDAMRAYISQSEWEESQSGGIATLSIVYQHKPKLMAELTNAQHSCDAEVMSTLHIHLTHSHCLEVLTIKGSKSGIEEIANRIEGLSGIEYARLFSFALPDVPEHGHSH